MPPSSSQGVVLALDGPRRIAVDAASAAEGGWPLGQIAVEWIIAAANHGGSNKIGQVGVVSADGGQALGVGNVDIGHSAPACGAVCGAVQTELSAVGLGTGRAQIENPVFARPEERTAAEGSGAQIVRFALHGGVRIALYTLEPCRSSNIAISIKIVD